MPSKSLSSLELTCATLLRVPASLSDDKRRARMNTRLHALGHAAPCGRCGGSGNYSYNQISGTRCFGCDGAGGVPPKMTRELLAEVEKSVAAGALDRYLEGVRMRQAAQGAEKQVMNAWMASGVSKAYDWQKAANGIEPDRQIANEINRPMCQAYEAVRKVAGELDSIGYKMKKAKTQEAREGLEAQRLQAAAKVIEEVDRSLQIIQNLTERLRELTADQGRSQEYTV